LTGDEFEMVFDQRKVVSDLVDLPQCELAPIRHINRHQRCIIANPRKAPNLRRGHLVSNTWLAPAVLA
jgi:hypothetical protein